MSIGFVIVLVILLLLGAITSMAETALFSLPRTQLHVYKKSLIHKEREIYKVLLQPRDLLVTLLCWNILVSLLVQNTVSDLFESYHSWMLQVGVPLLLTLFISELLPKIIALKENARIARGCISFIKFAILIVTPVKGLITWITNLVSYLLFFYLRPQKPLDSKEVLDALAKTDENSTIIDADEKNLIEGFLEFTQSQVKDLMWPKSEIVFYNTEDPLEKLTKLFTCEECSRLPVCYKELDSVIGILSAKDFLSIPVERQSREVIEPHLKKPYYVPETMPARKLIYEFQDKRQDLALVVDEYGSISGLITPEDLLEGIIGEIIDRRDQKKRYTVTKRGEVIASGRWELEQLEEVLGVRLKEDYDVGTVGGWIINYCGDIPKAGTQIESKYLDIKVLAADPSRIRRVYLKVKEEKESE